jgi:putative MATE family efflux protein
MPPASAESPTPSWWARIRDRDHTQGNLLVSVAVLSLPQVAMTGLGFGVFQLIDLRFLSQLGEAQVAAAGATNQTLRQILMLFLLGVGVTAQMRIARYVGAGDGDAADHVAGQCFVLGAVIALAALVAGGLFPEACVALVTKDPDVAREAVPYFQILFLAAGATIAMQLFASVLQGAGDATTPMLVSLLVLPVSILAEWVLAFGHFGVPALGIRGIALGAALGTGTGAAIAAWTLLAGRARVHLRARHFEPDWPVLQSLLATAWQPAMHMVARTFMVIFFMALAGRLGGEVQAAYTIGLRIEMLAIMVAFPISNACATLVGQSLGAGNPRRAWRAIFASVGVTMALLWPAALLLYFQRASFVSFFASDPAVAAIATEYLGYSSIVLLFYSVYFVAFRSLQAAGDMRTPMLISIGVVLCVGLPLAYGLAVAVEWGATGMWIANLVNVGVNCMLMVSWLARGHWAKPAAARV